MTGACGRRLKRVLRLRFHIGGALGASLLAPKLPGASDDREEARLATEM